MAVKLSDRTRMVTDEQWPIRWTGGSIQGIPKMGDAVERLRAAELARSDVTLGGSEHSVWV